MKLWLLRPADPDFHGWDVSSGFVVRAEDERQARELASLEAGDEGPNFWTSDKSRCVELERPGMPGVLLRDFNAG
jgi:hypothetical protein